MRNRKGRKQAVTNSRIKEARDLLRYMKAKNIRFSFSYLGYKLRLRRIDVQLALVDVLEQKGYISKDIPHFGRMILL